MALNLSTGLTHKRNEGFCMGHSCFSWRHANLPPTFLEVIRGVNLDDDDDDDDDGGRMMGLQNGHVLQRPIHDDGDDDNDDDDDDDGGRMMMVGG